MATQKSSSSSFTKKWNYDVFVSFRGEDTRKNFTDHLYAALHRMGFVTFNDDEKLPKGKEISAELIKAIEESMFSIIVLSKDYASSTWCLDELVKILECKETKGQMVLPVFYNVDPSEVRKQRESFAQAFSKHEEDFKKEMDKVLRWRTALTEVANLSGWNSHNVADGHEAKLIEIIVEKICSSKLDHTNLDVAKNPIGIDSRVEKILLRVEGLDDVRIIGICGLGGIGKTTIAKAVYNRIFEQFEGSCFLANVREDLKKNGPVHLQIKLLSAVLKANLNISSFHEGVSVIKERLCHKRILVILDDVDNEEQLEILAGKPDWFGLGSRIIITTRDKHLLTTYEVSEIYEVEELNSNEALHLFSLNAFKEDHPTSGFLELSKRIVDYAKGLPLALKVLGSLLFDKRSIDEWKSELEKLQRIPNNKIYEILKISFDGLETHEKNIFLDVACFFNGRNKDYVTKVLGSRRCFPKTGLRVLTQRSLITISNGELQMHDLLQEMGREIVYQESPNEPGKRSRLWLNEDVYDHVFPKNTGTDAVEGIILNFSKPKEVHFNNEAFMRMHNLRLLKVSNVHLSGGFEYFFRKSIIFSPERYAEMNEVRLVKDCIIHPFEDISYLSNELRCLNWHGYPSKSMPSSFHPKNLVELDMCCSRLEQLWKTKIILENLEFLNLSHCQYLTETPDFSGFPRLKMLILQGCTRLVEVRPSDLVLDKLVFLNLKDCKSLRSIWRSIKLESLENLILSGCSKLEKFPEILGTMEHLSKVYLDGIGIKELPSSIEHLTGLDLLYLKNCKNLTSLPNNICELKSLRTLTLSGCSKLDKLPENLGNMQNLVNLYLGGTSIKQLPSSIILLKNLQTLSFRGCNGSPSNSWKSIFSSWLFPRKIPCSSSLLLPSLSSVCSLTTLDLSDCNLSEGAILNDIVSLSSLQHLNLSKNNFVRLPASFSGLNCLKILKLEHCPSLQELPPHPSSILELDGHGCRSLEKLPYPSCLDKYFNNPFFTFSNCEKLDGCHGDIFLQIMSQATSESSDFNLLLTGSKIPKWFNYQSMGSSISFKMSPLDYSKCKGVALCAVFTLKGETDHDVVCFDSYLSDKTGAVPLLVAPIMALPRKRYTESDHVWLRYWPRDKLKVETRSDGWRHFEASLEFELGQVKKCGVHIFYEQDEAAMMQYKSPQNLGVFDANFDKSTVEEEEAIEHKRSLDDYNSDEDIKHKRLRGHTESSVQIQGNELPPIT